MRTTADEPSVSIHLLGTDVGCIERRAFDPEGGVESFRSHYTNVRCETTISDSDFITDSTHARASEENRHHLR